MISAISLSGLSGNELGVGTCSFPFILASNGIVDDAERPFDPKFGFIYGQSGHIWLL